VTQSEPLELFHGKDAREQWEIAGLAQDALSARGLNGEEILTLQCLWRLALALEEREPIQDWFIRGFLRVPHSIDLLARWRKKHVRTIQEQLKKFDALGFLRHETANEWMWSEVSDSEEPHVAPGVYVMGPLEVVKRLHEQVEVRNALAERRPDLYACDSYRRTQHAPVRMFGLPSMEELGEMVRRGKAHFSALSVIPGAVQSSDVEAEGAS
jgi:hypothetical protein